MSCIVHGEGHMHHMALLRDAAAPTSSYEGDSGDIVPAFGRPSKAARLL